MIDKYMSFRIILLLFLSLTVVAAVACEGDLDGESTLIEQEKKITSGEDENSMTSEQSFPELTMPPIDQTVPDNLETATLALG